MSAPAPTLYPYIEALREREVTVKIEGVHLWLNFDGRTLLYQHHIESEEELVTALGRAVHAVDLARVKPQNWIEVDS